MTWWTEDACTVTFITKLICEVFQLSFHWQELMLFPKYSQTYSNTIMSFPLICNILNWFNRARTIGVEAYEFTWDRPMGVNWLNIIRDNKKNVSFF